MNDEFVRLMNDEFVRLMDDYSNYILKHNLRKGFHCEPFDTSDAANCVRIALIHSELSEVVEASRMGNPLSEKIPNYCHAVEELADVVIRVMDMCAVNGYSLGEAIVAKMEYNEGREYLHGKKSLLENKAK